MQAGKTCGAGCIKITWLSASRSCSQPATSTRVPQQECLSGSSYESPCPVQRRDSVLGVLQLVPLPQETGTLGNKLSKVTESWEENYRERGMCGGIGHG